MLVHSPHSAIFAAFSGAGSLVTSYAASNFGQGPVPKDDWYIQMAGLTWGATELSLLGLYGASLASKTIYNAIDETKEKSILAKGKRSLMQAFKWAGEENLNRLDKGVSALAWTFLGVGNGFIAASALTTLMTVGTAGVAPVLLASLFFVYGASGVCINAAKICGLVHKVPENKVGKFMHDHAVGLNFGRETAGLFYYAMKGVVDPATTGMQIAAYSAGQLLTMGGYGILRIGERQKALQQKTPAP